MKSSGRHKVFVVEDDDWFRKMLVHSLEQNPDLEVKSFRNGIDFLNALTENPFLVTLDYRLPDTTGAELLYKIKSYNPSIEVVIISEQDEIEIALDLLKQGAYDYLIKTPDLSSRLFNSVNNLLKRFRLEKKVEHLQEEVQKKYDFSHSIIGQSDSIKKIFALLQKAASSGINVSITGETGTGKELVAKAIHYNSDRRNNSFVAVNISAIPKELIESELFGHEKGAFTGASEKRKGKLLEADGGTLFLDEIAEMELSTQTKLLRVLQERELTPLGSNTTHKFDVKLIIATHQNLKKLVEENKFREDLFFRIMGLNIHLPPLHDRDKDVLIIAKAFINEFCKANQIPIKSLSEMACKKLLSYSFPGNVRELKSVIEVAVVLSDGHEINDEHIIFQNSGQPVSGEDKTLREYNFELIQHYLKKYDNQIPVVAEKLDISSATIYRMIKEFKSESGSQ